MARGDVFALSKLLAHTSVEMTAKKYAALHPRFMKGVVDTIQFGEGDGEECPLERGIMKESGPYLAQKFLSSA